jgi:16S rRNA processing protein RimM
LLEYISVGYVLKPRGIKGEIKVEPLTDYIERFDELDVLYIKENDEHKPVKILSRTYSQTHVFLKLEGYMDRDQAERLRGQYLWITRDQVRDLPEDTFLIADIIGCAIYTKEGKHLGCVDNVIHTGSNDVYVTKGPLGEILIPGLKKVVLDVDIQEKKIIVSVQELEGLLPDAD